MFAKAQPDPVAALIRDGAVHSSLYTDPAIFAREMKTIFNTGWVFVGHDSEITARGNYLRRTLGATPVLMVRDKDGLINVIVNRCAHRGNLLCQEAKGTRKNFTCQYHGWVFDLKGALVDVPFPAGFKHDRGTLGLQKAHVGVYRGFVFASLADDPLPLKQHLGNAAAALDRAADLSPAGELDLSGGWVRHLFHANWKMLFENNIDGYHTNYVHDSFARGVKLDNQYGNRLVSKEDKVQARARDLGGGHADIEYSSTYARPLEWLGVQSDRYPDYARSMAATYGPERAEEIMRAGPPHTMIFPNLFIAETAITMIQPLSANRCVNWHTPMYLKDAPDVNQRLLRQCEAALGPGGFLLPDDATILARQWQAMDKAPAWTGLERGREREHDDGHGIRSGHYSDEITLRGFWSHYRELSSDLPAAAMRP